MGLIKPKKGGGIDTSDATATASDIARNKTAYVNGEKIIGNVTDIKSNATYDLRTTSCYVDEISYDMGYKSIDLKTKTKTDVLTRNGAIIKTVVMPYHFGNATVADVAKGKTFTSAAGLKVAGTYEPPEAGTLPELSNPADSSNITKGMQVIDKNGNVITGTHECPTLTDLLPELSNPASAEHIVSGYQTIDADGSVIEGTAKIGKFYSEVITLYEHDYKLTVTDHGFKPDGFCTFPVSEQINTIIPFYTTAQGKKPLVCGSLNSSAYPASLNLTEVSGDMYLTMDENTCEISTGYSNKNYFGAGDWLFMVWQHASD